MRSIVRHVQDAGRALTSLEPIASRRARIPLTDKPLTFVFPQYGGLRGRNFNVQVHVHAVSRANVVVVVCAIEVPPFAPLPTPLPPPFQPSVSAD